MTSKNHLIAEQFKNACEKLGWSFHVSNSVLKIKKSFPSGCKDSFSKADSEYYSLLSIIPTTSSGSIWGTDGSGVGAISAINNGLFEINKSGCSIRILNHLKKIQ